MSDWTKIILTALFTIAGAVLVYTFGEIFTKFFIEPIHDQKKIIWEIAEALIFYANIYANPGTASKETNDKAQFRLRQLASLLRSKTQLIPWYKFLAKLRIVIKRSNIIDASVELIRLSNSIHQQSAGGGRSNSLGADRIREYLKLEKEL